jgi:hypothetical protein
MVEEVLVVEVREAEVQVIEAKYNRVKSMPKSFH